MVCFFNPLNQLTYTSLGFRRCFILEQQVSVVHWSEKITFHEHQKHFSHSEGHACDE